MKNKEERNRMLLNEAVYNSLNRGEGRKMITLERPSSAHTTTNQKEKKDAISINIDAEKLIEKYMTMNIGKNGKNFTKILK